MCPLRHDWSSELYHIMFLLSSRGYIAVYVRMHEARSVHRLRTMISNLTSRSDYPRHNLHRMCRRQTSFDFFQPFWEFLVSKDLKFKDVRILQHVMMLYIIDENFFFDHIVTPLICREL